MRRDRGDDATNVLRSIEPRAWMVAVAACALFGVTGCSSASGGDGSSGTGWTSPRADADTGTKGGDGWGSDTDGGGEREPRSTTFRLENSGERPLHVRAPLRSGCGVETPGWLSVGSWGGRGLCPCDVVEPGAGECYIGGPPCVPPENETATIEPGSSVEWTWGGTLYEASEKHGVQCRSGRVPEPGETLQAEVCWWSVEGQRAERCETLEFEYGRDTVVQSVDTGGSRTPVDTTFKMKNETDSELYVRRLGPCSSQYPWLSLRDGDTSLALDSTCRVCSCSDLKSGQCGVCGVACPEPGAQPLEPGETRSFQWDGVARRQKEIEGRACHERWIPPRGRELKARFCTVPGPLADGTPECETVTFRYGEETTVTKTYDSESSAIETTFQLENSSSKVIRIRPFDSSCRHQPPGWLTLERNGAELNTNRGCGECSCSALEEQGTCPVCAPPRCDPDATKDVQPGQTVEWSWPGYLYERATRNDQVCYEQKTPSPGRSFEAEFCWEELLEGKRAYDTRCQTREFIYGQSNAVVTTVK